MSHRPSRADVDDFRDVLAGTVGLRFDDDKLPLLTDLLADRLRASACESVAAYLERVAPTANEIAELARVLSVSETYFLRNRDQFRVLEDVLRERAASSVRHIRVLSAGCSSGEEAYSVAIVIRETLRDVSAWNVSVLGVDVNPDSVERARAGRYGRWSLRETPDAIRKRYFQTEGSHHVLDPEIQRVVRFERKNLVSPDPALWRREAYDIVFCRNVLMYFTPPAARAVVSHIAGSMAPAGVLFLGHAENLRGLSHEFHLKHSRDTFYYERRDASEATRSRSTARRSRPAAPAPLVAPRPDDSWFDAIAHASARIEQISQRSAVAPTAVTAARPSPRASHDLVPAMDLMEQEKFHEALRLLAGAPPAASREPDALLLRAVLLVNTADVDGAQAQCAEILEIDELNAGAHYLMAICREHAGDRAGAIEHSQAASYLDGDFAMPHLQLGRLARRAGDALTARRELTLAMGLLAREDAARIVLFGGGFTRETLIEICRRELDACGGAR